jgi:hypothetical protein
MTKVGVSYNVQLAVDTKHKMIAEQEVCNQVIDLGLLVPTVKAAMDTLGVDKHNKNGPTWASAASHPHRN